MTIAKIPLEQQDETANKISSEASPERNDEFNEILDPKLPFQILGFNKERKILAWYKGHLMFFTISQLRADELELFTELKDEEDKKRVKSRIIQEARERSIIDESEPIKVGVWLINGKWLIVSGKNAFEVHKGKIREINFPVYEGKIIQFGKPWLDISKFQEKFKNSSLSNVYNKLHKYISQWCWKEQDAAEYLTALIMVIAFQHAMKWRPWVYISGETGTGKSLFLDEVVELLFQGLIKRADKTTEYAIYQSVGNTSRILCLDEFEKSRHIPQIMEALKLMSRGGEKTTGTPGEKELTHSLHHIPILASIYTPATCVKDESQRNRLMRFELTKPKDRTPPTIWSKEEAEELLSELIAAGVENWEEIQEKANNLVSKTKEIKKKMEGVDDRTIQNFMYVSSILQLVTGKEYTVPSWAKIEKKSDGQSIIETIIFSKIRYENEDYLVTDLLDVAMRRPSSNSLDVNKAKNALRLHGLTTVESGEGYLAIRTDQATKQLLKSEEFKGVDISLPLERITGSVNKKANFGGNSSLASIQIPMSVIDDLRGYTAI